MITVSCSSVMNILFNAIPKRCRTATITIESPATISKYSIAAAADSSPAKRTNNFCTGVTARLYPSGAVCDGEVVLGNNSGIIPS